MRPRREREINSKPTSRIFAPVDCPFEDKSPVMLSLDEYEAIRLADLEGMYHQQAAEEMNVSRQTFGRILKEARKKIASHIVDCRRLIIKGGDVILKKQTWRCMSCGRMWESNSSDSSCPDCDSSETESLQPMNRGQRGKGRRMRKMGK